MLAKREWGTGFALVHARTSHTEHPECACGEAHLIFPEAGIAQAELRASVRDRMKELASRPRDVTHNNYYSGNVPILRGGIDHMLNCDSSHTGV